MQYSGITPEALFLLSENRLRDSRDFYEEHKEQINALAIGPMRRIAQTAGEYLQGHDPLIAVVPGSMVSRVRRDTRFTKDKTLYRDNIWLSVGRGKTEWPLHPMFWFEFFPDRYWLGVGYWEQPPAFVEFFRRWIINNAEGFLAAYKKAQKAGYKLDGDDYKKPKVIEGCSDELLPFMGKKSVYFPKESDDIEQLALPDFPQTLCGEYKKLLPLYDCLAAVSDAYAAMS